MIRDLSASDAISEVAIVRMALSAAADLSAAAAAAAFFASCLALIAPIAVPSA